MSKRRLLVRSTEPLFAKPRQAIRDLHRQIQASANVQRAQLWLRLRQGGSPPAVGMPLTTSELAHQIARLPSLQQDPVLLQAARLAITRENLPLFACLYWLDSIQFQLRWPLPMRRAAFRTWFQHHAPAHYLVADQILASGQSAHAASLPFRERPFGVNLVGHASSILGLGEYLRMMARAFDAAAIPFCIHDISSTIPNGSGDQSLAAKTLEAGQSLPYAFTLFCMTANTQLDLAVCESLIPGRHTYTIACWFWEMEQWPSPLRSTLALADEFWPCTHLIETALAAAMPYPPRPVVYIPPVVDLSAFIGESHPSRSEIRDRFGLVPDVVQFVFSFDLNSAITRKNPQAVLHAFQLAFGAVGDTAINRNVGLVIKALAPEFSDPLWDELKALAATDERVRIIEASLDRSTLLLLFHSCDVFVSLHRSEGLGLGPAEALQLGLDVIATDYGGNTDFCDGPLAHPVSYRLIPVQAGEYFYHEELFWADPDVSHAATLMQEVADRRQHDGVIDPALVEGYRERFSAGRIGRLYRTRLEQLWAARDDIQRRLDQF